MVQAMNVISQIECRLAPPGLPVSVSLWNGTIAVPQTEARIGLTVKTRSAVSSLANQRTNQEAGPGRQLRGAQWRMSVRSDTGCGVYIWRAPRTRLIAAGYRPIKYWVQSCWRTVRCHTRLRVRMFTQRTDRRPASRAAIVLLLTVFVGACASSEPPSEATRRSNDAVSTAQPKGAWSEINSPLPPYPRAENLAEFQIAGTTSFRFFADLASVRVDADGVDGRHASISPSPQTPSVSWNRPLAAAGPVARLVRFTVIARSASGVENVSFEGIHCESREYKVYAYGSTDRTWIRPRNPTWQSISSTSNNDLRNSLYRYYLCPKGLAQRDAKKAVAVLKRGRPNFGDYRGF